MSIDFSVHGEGPLFDGRAEAMIKATVREYLTKTGKFLVGEIGQRTPIAWGVLKKSITSKVSMAGDEVRIFAGAESAQYALSVELGSKPHYPPLAPLILWVRRKLPIEGFGSGKGKKPREGDAFEAAVESAARAIQHKIGRYGTKPVGMFKRGVEENESPLEQIAAEYALILTRRLDGGGGPA